MASTLQRGRAAPEFTADWSGARNYWPSMFADLKLAGRPRLRFLEIGCFEGMATLWLVQNVLTHPTSRIDVVDTFEGSVEFEPLGVEGSSWERFSRNLAGPLEAGKVVAHQGRSADVLRNAEEYGLVEEAAAQFDFVYVDGSHVAADVLADAVLAWPLLKPGAMMVFDDYDWNWDAPEVEKPKAAVDAFVRCYRSQLEPRFVGYQYVVEKL